MREFDFYIVGTPIGNLGDMSPRAVEVLKSVDFIAAEDTRRAMILLNRFEIKKPLICYFEHNREKRGGQIIAELEKGRRGALVTDAGMPAVSDPGAELVRLLHDNGFSVTAVPGPTAFSTALVLSGLDTARFTFEGFLPTQKKERKARLLKLRGQDCTLIFYEGVSKLVGTLRDVMDELGDRRAAVCRELTKLYEQTVRGRLSEIIDYFLQNEPRGEFVIVVEGARECDTDKFWQKLSLSDHVGYYVNTGCDRKEAIKRTALDRKMSKSEVYNAVMKKEG